MLTNTKTCAIINLSQMCEYYYGGEKMVNVLMLKGKVIEKGYTLEKVAESIGIDRSTMSRKLGNAGEDFTIKQADGIVSLLGLTPSEATSIFFSQFIA